MTDTSWAERLNQGKETLSRREQDLLDWITANPQDAAFLRLHDLADASGVSKPIIISCYRALHYGDYQEFQQGMQNFYAGQIDSYRASTVALKDIAGVTDLLEACFAVERAALDSFRKNLDSHLVETIAREILEAPAVYVYGDGTGFYPGQYLVQRMRSCGIRSYLAGTDREHAMDDLMPIGVGDVFLSFNYTQDADTLVRILEFSTERGAVTILLAGFLDPRLCRFSRYHLFVPRGQLNFKNSMAVPMIFAHMLLMAVELLGGDTLSGNLKRVEMHRKGIQYTEKKERS